MSNPTLPADTPGDARALVHTALHEADFRRAHVAVQHMLEVGVDQTAALQGLAEGLHHPDPLVRRRAAQAFGLLGPAAQGAVPALTSALHDPSWTVREVVVQSLAALPVEGTQVGTELVARALHDRSPLVRQAAGWAVVRLSRLSAAELQPALGDGHAKVRRRAVTLLGQMPAGTVGIIPLLRAALTDGHVKVRLTAAEVLATRGAEAVPVIPRLVRCAFDGDQRVQLAATESVRRLLREPTAAPLGWLAATLHDAHAALGVGLSRRDLPLSVQQEFTAACARRRRWHSGVEEPVAVIGAEEAAESAAAAAQEVAERRQQQDAAAARGAEFAWLLGLLCELWLNGGRSERLREGFAPPSPA